MGLGAAVQPGGSLYGLQQSDLNQAYLSQVDPRLNYEQALEMAMMVARKMSSG